MCGIAGSVNLRPSRDKGALLSIAQGMGGALVHRGPDDSGEFVDENHGLTLSHRRLSILDLSPLGHQPMSSRSGRYVISYNGEIYNYRELGVQLEKKGASFLGSSDTEVLLAAIEEWGIEGALTRLVGMFAFALWDKEERTLTLARDRLGEKPLYYGWNSGSFLFGSELKALRAHPSFSGEIDRSALTLFLRHNCIPAPYSIYQHIFKLLPASFLTLGLDALESRPSGFCPWGKAGERASPQFYWKPGSILEQSCLSERDALQQLEQVLSESVRGQLISDVPLGAFLSGGIDSSLIAALMQKASPSRIKTFSIGFSEAAYDEAPHAKLVAAHLGTDHTEWYVSPEHARNVIPRLPELFDEPFADSSQIPTFLVSQLARRSVTVSLSGDGGDELFCGYERYSWAASIWRLMRAAPAPLRSLVSAALRLPGPKKWEWLMTGIGAFPFKKWRLMHPGEKVLRFAELLGNRSREGLFCNMVSQWDNPEAVVIDGPEPASFLTSPALWPQAKDFLSQMMFFDLKTYLPDDILVKVDRASMAASLESRAPFLDHRVVECALRIPTSLKLKGGTSKWILRELLSKFVPRELFERPKMGFGVPIDSWLRGELREWADDLLSEERLRREGFFHPGPIREKWLAHRSGERSFHYPLWNVLMFEAWLGLP
jgi:asparagine synthase (glutamine-hydrolysing)